MKLRASYLSVAFALCGVFVSCVSAEEEKLCADKCGDGICQEIVCMGQGCPCPESSDSCPKDCSAGK